MFYLISKPLWFVATPSNALIVVLVVATVVGLLRRSRIVATVGLLAALLLAVAGFGPLGELVLMPLETRFPAHAADAPSPTGIVVLGGAVDDRLSRAHGTLEMNGAAERIVALADLARRHPQSRILFSSGAGEYFAPEGTSEGETLRRHLGELGVDPARIEFETRSRNTAENARFSAEILKPKAGETWWLVTSAWHMPRSIGCFRRADFTVVAHPVDRRTTTLAEAMVPNGTASDGLVRLDMGLREWLGLVVYRLTDRTDALLPAP